MVPQGWELTAAAAPVKISSPSVSLSPASGSDPPAAPSDSGSMPGKGGGSRSEALQPPPPDAIFLHRWRKQQQQLYRQCREQSAPAVRGARGPLRTPRDQRGGASGGRHLGRGLGCCPANPSPELQRRTRAGQSNRGGARGCPVPQGLCALRSFICHASKVLL